jgi:5-methylcytosine-specific restriction endonuclease McrA
MSDVETNTVTKICTVCKEEKLITEFSVHRGIKCGYASRCKKCTSVYKKTYDEQNKESKSNYNKIWYLQNKENIAERVKLWREENKEKRYAYNKLWYEQNRERKNALDKIWSSLNPEKKAVHGRNRRSRKRLATGTHTDEDIHNLFRLQKKKCAVCNKSISKGYDVDHIVALSNGGSNDKYNLQLLCTYCNRSKHAKDPIEFMQEKGMLL